MVRMLHIVGSMAPSGIGNYIMNVYRHIDRSKVQFDFIVHEHREVSFEEEIESMGGKIYVATQKHDSPIKNFRDIRSVVKKGGYNVVFRHADNAMVALDLLAAKMGGARVRIPHSHSTSTPNPNSHYMFQPMLNKMATMRFACSEAAGEWLYGKGQDFRVIQNAIDLEDFSFKKSERDVTRKKLSLHNKTVVGHIGNFMPVKNHFFMLDVLKEMVKKNPDTVLLLVGDGDLRPQIEKKIDNIELRDHVILAGVRTDTPALLSAMDAFIFPSFYEGMPIAMVEAQATGLPCIVSDPITRLVDVSDRVTYLPLDKKAEVWADKILEEADTYRDKRDNTDRARFVEAGFDINEMVKTYEELV